MHHNPTHRSVTFPGKWFLPDVPPNISRADIRKKHFEVFQSEIKETKLKQDVLHSLEAVGLIEEVDDENDKRRKLLVPLVFKKEAPTEYSEQDWRVNQEISSDFVNTEIKELREEQNINSSGDELVATLKSAEGKFFEEETLRISNSQN